MTIYPHQPYFYVIQDIRNGIYYVGSKFGKDANPNKFMVEGGYHTSSKTINKLIKKHGLEIFIVRKIKTFKKASDAYLYEKRFLEKVNARNNNKLYNRHNNKFHAFGTKEYSELMVDLIGVENPSSLSWVKQKKKESYVEKYGVDNPMKCETIKEKTKTTNKNRYGGNSPFCSNEVKEKYIENNMEKYGFAWPMERTEVKKKREETFITRYGDNNPLKNEYVAKKSLETLENKYGVTHNSQIPSVKEAKRLKEQLKLQRSELLLLEQYSIEHKISLGSGWRQRKDIWIYQKLKELYDTYGPLSSTQYRY